MVVVATFQESQDFASSFTKDRPMFRALTACAFTLSTMIAATASEKGMASHYSTRDKNQNGSKTASARPLRDHELTAAAPYRSVARCE
jgi:rare lipoprotein A (peptidoglycan hydrolase)